MLRIIIVFKSAFVYGWVDFRLKFNNTDYNEDGGKTVLLIRFSKANYKGGYRGG